MVFWRLRGPTYAEIGMVRFCRPEIEAVCRSGRGSNLNTRGHTWNNNNAEHAIKHFADYRNTVAGQIREFGLRNYLMLLSAYQTCEYKGISFLKFLLSKEIDIDKFRLLKNDPNLQNDFDPQYNSDVGKYDRSDNASFL